MKNYLAIEVYLNEEDANDFLMALRTKMENEKVIYECLTIPMDRKPHKYVVIVTGINPDMYELLNNWRDETDFKINVIKRLLED